MEEDIDDLEITDRAADWNSFLKKHYRKELGEISAQYPHLKSLEIDYRELSLWGKTGLEIADEVLHNPGKVIGDVKDAIRNHNLIFTKDESEKADNINVRFRCLPRKIDVRDIRAHHINSFISVEGILRKTTEVRPRLTEAVFRCLQCGTMSAPYRQEYSRFQEPYRPCAQCERATKMELVPGMSTFVDAQKLRIQESPEGLRGGEQPQTLDVDVTDDLTGTVAPGDRVIINGILRSVQRMNHGNKSTLFDIYIEANSIEIGEKEFEEVAISEQDEEIILNLSKDPEIYEKISRSIAPSIFGMQDVKTAISLVLFGGISKEMPDGSRLRGDIHMLLVGDPGIAKSQVLRYVIKLSPRGIYTSGKSSTSAGLTATAVKDEFGDGRWTLEAGALVLADMGIAAVDEMDKMAKEDRSALHEAMEQQTISIAKAGITATLRSRCSLLGAANPKMGRFDEYAPIAEQINMPPSLLSRFDLIFIMEDKPEEKLDRAIGEHILKSHSVGELIQHNKKFPMEGIDEDYITRQLAPVTPEIDPTIFRKYIAYAKRNCFPILSDEAREHLIGYYLNLRSLADDNTKPVPVTARQLEGLVRLSEASARIRLSNEIEFSDADRVIEIADRCLKKVAYDAETGTYDIDKLVTGVSKKRRDIARILKETIRELADDKGFAQISDITSHLISSGYKKDDIEKMVDQLTKSGEALEPRHGVIRLIN
ncbi:minichromosome maintenance protein MCM [Methanogenium sp. MK-MG]|uniref:minichromosome maintenance protein MCM n=1 Tax=Methanogenium sp. MK-MG TaxID=2599926 RepID=UPI001C204D0B|nr:minichromosome maintenance protein MCM [Methanogenium sp. MK-MG]KAF1078372.1 Minichromosome maintenance protein MCM [Methanogenium sp. MK-MG]